MIGEKTTAPGLRLLAGGERPSAESGSAYDWAPRAPEEHRPSPPWTDLLTVLGVCVLFWAGLALLIAAWA